MVAALSAGAFPGQEATGCGVSTGWHGLSPVSQDTAGGGILKHAEGKQTTPLHCLCQTLLPVSMAAGKR